MSRIGHADMPAHGPWNGLLLALIFLLAFSASAARAATVDIGPGVAPTVSVDSQGVAYIVYNDSAATHPSVHLCKSPRTGAIACGAQVTLTPPNESLTRPYVFVDGSTVRLLTYRYALPSGPFSQNFLYVSTDGGQTFGAPIALSADQPGQRALDPFNAIEGPGGQLSLVNDVANITYQAVATDGSSVGASSATLSTAYQHEGDVGLVNATTPLVTFNDGAATQTTAFSVYKGVGSLNDSANWTPATPIAPGSNGHLAGGPSGLFLMLHTQTGGLEIRKFNGSSFGGPSQIPGSAGGSLVESHLYQDAGGELHAVFNGGNQQLKYSTSFNGVTWNSPTVIATDTDFNGLRVAAAPNHQGVAVWQSDGSAGRRIRATRLTVAGCVVPRVKGRTLSAAKRAIKNANCAVGRVTRRKSTSAKRGHVLSSRPTAGRRLPRGTKVSVVVAR